MANFYTVGQIVIFVNGKVLKVTLPSGHTARWIMYEISRHETTLFILAMANVISWADPIKKF